MTPQEEIEQTILQGMRHSASLGLQTWADVALYERAIMGMVLYGTWIRLSDKERDIIGRMNQSTARRKLRI
jgi:hypothetical protein